MDNFLLFKSTKNTFTLTAFGFHFYFQISMKLFRCMGMKLFKIHLSIRSNDILKKYITLDKNDALRGIVGNCQNLTNSFQILSKNGPSKFKYLLRLMCQNLVLKAYS